MLVDREGTVVGLGVTGVPGRDLGDWRGFAVAPAGTDLTAYGVVEAGLVCRLGAATVAAAPSRPAADGTATARGLE